MTLSPLPVPRDERRQLPGVVVPRDAEFGDDGAHQPGRGHVESRVVYGNPLRCQLLLADMGDFTGVTLLDRDL